MFDIENSVGFLLAKAYQRAWALFKEELDPYELTPPQFALLAFLWQEDGLTQVELSERSQVDRTTTGGLIDRLERGGLVARHPHLQDRRAYRIRLTERGKELEGPLTAAAAKVLRQLTSGLTDTDVADLARMLGALRGERTVYGKPKY